MKCLFVSDLHYALKQYDWVLNCAEQFDLVIVGGDHLDISSSVHTNVQTLVILKYLQRLGEKVTLISCSGNHDLDARNQEGEKFARWIFKAQRLGVLIDGCSLNKEGVLFTICPWWDGPKTRVWVEQQLKNDYKKDRNKWIWVYHSPPEHSPTSWDGKKHIGDVELLAWIERYQPDMVLTGHIHQSPFVENGSWADRIGKTWVFNPGRQMGSFPTHIVLDIHNNHAQWFSFERAEMVNLNQPLQRPLLKVTELPVWFK